MKTRRKSLLRLLVGALAAGLVLGLVLTVERNSKLFAGPTAVSGLGGQGQGKGHAKRGEQARENNEGEENEQGRQGDEERRLPRFGTRDRRIIAEYYRNRYSNLPPGLAKRGGNLPPGLERQLERNGTLPPGLQKRLEPFPPELDRRLPPLPPDYTRGVVGQVVVIINKRTGRIADAIHGVITATMGR